MQKLQQRLLPAVCTTAIKRQATPGQHFAGSQMGSSIFYPFAKVKRIHSLTQLTGSPTHLVDCSHWALVAWIWFDFAIYQPARSDPHISRRFCSCQCACGNASCLMLLPLLLQILLLLALALAVALFLLHLGLESWQATFWFWFQFRFAGCYGLLLTLFIGNILKPQPFTSYTWRKEFQRYFN